MLSLPSKSTYSESFFAELLKVITWELPLNDYVVQVFEARSPLDDTFTISLLIKVPEHFRTWPFQVFVPGFQVQADITFSSLTLYRSNRPQTDALLRDAFLQKAMTLAPYLYEVDPRIGTRFQVAPPHERDEEGNKFRPSSILFDLPGGSYLPWEDIRQSEFPPSRLWCRCGICSRYLEGGEPVVWGGGYLRWVCSSCEDSYHSSELHPGHLSEKPSIKLAR